MIVIILSYVTNHSHTKTGFLILTDNKVKENFEKIK